MAKQPESFLPLSQATFYILLSLRAVRHGYGIMQDIEEISKGEVTMGPGTLYGALGKLEKQKVIEKAIVQQDNRRKYYQLTELGRAILQHEFIRLKSLVENSSELIKEVQQ
ncbi:helix-turn-helix transcriptional regulator [Gracilibacillus oryzae]|uniref:Helix-turn-helix transcriptional regulator n=1 Tax=Gracilibacillus oryzae TaxID=1672701 RepID=A0A7C8L187_9BACI|nr:PadR family transcriptional regulator [Gracilibacillus oryzae]KAB8126628.1 helix-turn-helix transcriptional regulator [Gracilibacillus oryzae]